MAKAGYCSQCGENVYLNPDGSCTKGHGADCVSNAYEVPDAPAPAPAPAPQPAYQPPAQPAPSYQAPPAYAPPTPVTTAAPAAYAPAPPKKKRTGLVIALVILALLFLCCVGGGAAFYFIGKSAESSGGASGTVPSDPEKAKTEAAWRFTKAIMLGDTEALKASVPADTVAAVDPGFWTSFTESSKSEDATVQGETWEGAVLKVAVKNGDGDGTITLTPSKPDAEHVEVSIALAGREATMAQAKVQQVDGAWKVMAFGTSDLSVPFDKDGLLKFINEQ